MIERKSERDVADGRIAIADGMTAIADSMTTIAGGRRRTRTGLMATAGAVLLLAAFAQGCASTVAARSALVGPAASLAQALEGLVWPLRFDSRQNVTSPYGYRARGGGHGPHYGLDLGARRGDPIYSAGRGSVAAVESGGAYGRSIRLDHGGELFSLYAHLDGVMVAVGERVRRGQVIGLVGSTGNATGPHLHFELRWRERWVDPLVVLPRLSE